MLMHHLDNLNLVCLMGNHIACPSSWCHPTFSNNFSKLYLITGGHADITIKDNQYKASYGKLFLIPANTVHSYRNDKYDPIVQYYLHFNALWGGKDLFEIFMPEVCIDVQNMDYIESLFQNIIANPSDARTFMKQQAMLMRLLAYYFKSSQKVIVLDTHHNLTYVQKALDYIEQNIHRRISVSELASLVHINQDSFTRTFFKHTGITPARYINNRKMELAKQLLIETDIPISEIMERIGFFEKSHFIRRFKAYTGISPNRFRASSI